MQLVFNFDAPCQPCPGVVTWGAFVRHFTGTRLPPAVRESIRLRAIARYHAHMAIERAHQPLDFADLSAAIEDALR